MCFGRELQLEKWSSELDILAQASMESLKREGPLERAKECTRSS